YLFLLCWLSPLFPWRHRLGKSKVLPCHTGEADIYVLIDGSTSIYPVDFGDIKKFLKEVIKMFNIGLNKVRFGAVQFSHSRSLEFELDEYSKRDDLETAIDNIRQIYGNTYIGEALTFMQPLFKKAREQRAGRVPCHLIVLTDGKSHDSVKESAERLRSEMVNIYAIGVKDADEAQLLEIAGSKSRTYFVQEFDSLKNIKNEIVQGILSCNSCGTHTSSSPVIPVLSPSGSSCTQLGYRDSSAVDSPGSCCDTQVTSLPHFYLDYTNINMFSSIACKEMTADIMFLVDSSGSIGLENFSKMKNFMRELVNKSDISRDRVQVGVVQFSDIKKEEFQLNQYSSKSDIFSAIDKMSLIGETTLTGGALTFVADYFRHPKGARPAVRKILILITDGEARDAVESPAKALRDQGVVIYSVGVFNANKTQLEEISGKHELVFYIENFDILKESIQAEETKNTDTTLPPPRVEKILFPDWSSGQVIQVRETLTLSYLFMTAPQPPYHATQTNMSGSAQRQTHCCIHAAVLPHGATAFPPTAPAFQI
uniref:VWFA domain-containing protein n=1 Tax=Gopherus agassizii TaxID=38772 RepID=A0A452IQ68_9SAUR